MTTPPATFAGIKFEELIPRFRKGPEVKDRKYIGTTYPQCFIGKEAVTWLVNNTPITNRKEAVKLGQHIQTMGVFDHVTKKHRFNDKDYYFRFNAPPTSVVVVTTVAPPPTSLYERLGGAKGIAAVVDNLMDRVTINPVILANPIVKELFASSYAPSVKFSISELVCMATGGPQKYSGGHMREVHATMKITDKEWDAFAADLKGALEAFKVPAKEQEELFAIVGSLKPDIVQNSLYDRLGGLHAIVAVVDDFAPRVLANQVINANPIVKAGFEKASVPAFKYYLTEFICSAAGGPQKYSGKSMQRMHAGMKITDAEWDALVGELKATLDKFQVPTKEQTELSALLGTIKSQIVEVTAKKSLYDRLGGYKAIALVVDDLIDRVRADYVLNANTIVKELNIKGLPSSFKYLVTEIVCQATGGPQQYSGKPMKDVHADMKITEREWQQFIALFKGTCDKFKVPVAEQQEAIGIFNTLKKDIVSA